MSIAIIATVSTENTTKMFFLLFWSLAKRREVISPNFLHLLQLAKLGKIGHSLIHRQVLMIERLTKFFLGVSSSLRNQPGPIDLLS